MELTNGTFSNKAFITMLTMCIIILLAACIQFSVEYNARKVRVVEYSRMTNLNEVQASQSNQLAYVSTQQQQMCECIRDGEKIDVSVEQVVVGDVVVLRANSCAAAGRHASVEVFNSDVGQACAR
jgi:magnesium-transporting ATPase (P-type)